MLIKNVIEWQHHTISYVVDKQDKRATDWLTKTLSRGDDETHECATVWLDDWVISSSDELSHWPTESLSHFDDQTIKERLTDWMTDWLAGWLRHCVTCRRQHTSTNDWLADTLSNWDKTTLTSDWVTSWQSEKKHACGNIIYFTAQLHLIVFTAQCSPTLRSTGSIIQYPMP